MLSKNSFLLLFFLAISVVGFSQQQLLFGRIQKKGGTETIPGVNIVNFNQKKYNTSDQGGDFRVPASPGDTLIFSSAGYLPDTLIVASPMFTQMTLVLLTPNMLALQTVQIDEYAQYQADSIQRREEYKAVLDRLHPVVLMNQKRPGDNPGFSFSFLGYFSKTEKQKRKLKKRLNVEEEDYYIDYKFSSARIAQMTRLTGESLDLFMRRYRPSYKFCRRANGQDMFFYVNEKLKSFRPGRIAQGDLSP